MTPNRRRLELAMPWIVIVGLLIVWQAAVQVFQIRQFILPSPVAIYQAFLQYREPIIRPALFTLFNTLIGFGIGIVVGMLLGIVIGSFRLAYAGLYPLLIGINSVPKAAVVPILVIWMGIGRRRRSPPRSCCRSSRSPSTSRPALPRSSPSSRTCCVRSARAASTCCARSACRGRCPTSSPR